MSGESFVKVERVSKSFGDNRVLTDVSLDVAAHEVVCLIGASGSGKSTLLRCINLLEKVDAGSITVDGQNLTQGKVDVNALRQQIGIVFQAYNLFPHMTVLQNVTLAPIRVLGQDRATAEDKAMALLTRIGLAHKAKEYPDRLSGGQQQRVAIVRALAMDPMILLLDEITSALDPELVSEVLNIVRDLAGEGMTMLLATHEMGFAREVSGKVCFLCDGAVYEEGSPEQIFDDPQKDRTKAFLRSIREAKRI
jgi:polar amino acid transport system ATP-binding protein